MKTTPYLKDLSTSEQTIPAENGDFKLFFTIVNPEMTEFTPHIKINYDDENIRSKDFSVKLGESLELNQIPRKQQKTYYLSFGTTYNSKPGTYKIDVAMYNSSDALTPLDKIQSTQIIIGEKIENAK